jgi:hypothetical protein
MVHAMSSVVEVDKVHRGDRVKHTASAADQTFDPAGTDLSHTTSTAA